MYAEIIARLQSFGPDAQVELIRLGFLRYRPPPRFFGPMLNKGKQYIIEGPWRAQIMANDELRWAYFEKPAVWRVRWMSATQRSQVRYIYLHVGDFSNAAFIGAVLKSTKEQLSGIYISGIGLPEKKSLQLILDTLLPEGLFVAALGYINAEGKSSESQENKESASLLANEMKLMSSVETSDDTRHENPRMFFPSLNLFQK